MSFAMLRCETFPTPLKVANAVPAISMQGVEVVHEDYAIYVVSEHNDRNIRSLLHDSGVLFGLNC